MKMYHLHIRHFIIDADPFDLMSEDMRNMLEEKNNGIPILDTKGTEKISQYSDVVTINWSVISVKTCEC